MTFADKFYSIVSIYIFSSLSYIGEVFCILSVVFLMLSFLGAEGEVNRWTFMPSLFYTGIVVVINAFCVIHDYIVLKDHWNEPYQENVVSLSDKSDFQIIFTVLIIALLVVTAVLTFTSSKVKNVIMAGIMMVFFETYISCEMKYAAMYFSEEPKNYVLKYSGIEGYLGSGFSNFFIVAYMVIMFSIFLLLYFGMIKSQRTMYIGWRNRIFFIFWEVLMIIIMYVPVMGGVSGLEQVRYMQYELGIIMVLMGFAVPFLMITMISRRYALEKTLIQEAYISAELDYINQYKQNQMETRAFRHDIINNLSLLSAMHDDKKYEEIEEYLSTLFSSISAMSPRYVTGDEMLNCIIGMKSSKMDEERIDFSTEGVIAGGLGMKPIDVCSIFANALDNAIEACEKIEEEKNRWIKLSLEKTSEFFMIRLRNAMTSGGGASNKDRNLHGYGIQNMKTTISKYNGTGTVDVKDNVYTLSIKIPREA